MTHKEAVDRIVDGISNIYNFKLIRATNKSKLYVANIRNRTEKADYLTMVYNTITTNKKTTYSVTIYPGLTLDLRAKDDGYITYYKYFDNHTGNTQCRLLVDMEVFGFKNAIDIYLGDNMEAYAQR